MNSCVAKAVRRQGCVSWSKCVAANAVDVLIAARVSPYGLRSGALAQDRGCAEVASGAAAHYIAGAGLRGA